MYTYTYKNIVTVEEEIAQYNYIFKQLLLVHEEYHYWMCQISLMMMNGLKKLIKKSVYIQRQGPR